VVVGLSNGMTRFSFLCLLYISTASAQSIWVGVKGGLPLTQAFNAIENPQPLTVTAFYQNSEGLLRSITTAQPSARFLYSRSGVEIRLWRHIRVEADGLYSRAVTITPRCVRQVHIDSYFDALKHAVDRVDTPVLVSTNSPSGGDFIRLPERRIDPL